MRWAVAAALLLAACEKDPAASGVRATREQCEEIATLVQAHAAAANAVERGRPTHGFRHTEAFFSDNYLALCEQRTTRRQADCEIARLRTGAIDMSPCKPEVDLRPPDARRTAEECVQYVAKRRSLAATIVLPPGLTPDTQLADASAHGAAAECAWWLSKARYDCVMAAPDDAAATRCPP